MRLQLCQASLLFSHVGMLFAVVPALFRELMTSGEFAESFDIRHDHLLPGVCRFLSLQVFR